MKKTVIWLLVLAAVIGCGVFLGARWLENSWLPRQMAAISIQGQPVHFAKVPEISFFPPAITLGPFEWQGRTAGMAASFSGQGAVLTPNVMSFLGTQPELKELLLASPKLHLEKTDTHAEKQTGNDAESEWSLGIGRFVAQDGSLDYVDGQNRMTLENLRVIGENLRPRQEMALQCDFGLSMTEKDVKALDGNFALKASARYYTPSLTFRNGSATFTATGPDSMKIFSPLHARFDGAFNLRSRETRLASGSLEFPAGRMELEGESQAGSFSGKARLELDNTELKPQGGNLVLESPFSINAEKLELRGADITWGDLQASLDAVLNFTDSDRILTAGGQWADGVFSASLDSSGGRNKLRISGDRISLGEALGQLGIHGFAGGPTKAEATFELGAGAPALARGRGFLECGRLELEPFGEMSMLLPLLGRSSAIMPRFVDQIKIGMSMSGGRLNLAPITGTGPEFSMSGASTFDLLANAVHGGLILKALGLELPLAFDGAIRSPAIRIDPELLRRKKLNAPSVF